MFMDRPPRPFDPRDFPRTPNPNGPNAATRARNAGAAAWAFGRPRPSDSDGASGFDEAASNARPRPSGR